MKAKETLIPKPAEPVASPNSPAAAASVVGISKRFGKTSILENISFDVAEGEVLVLLGASGSGKSSVVRAGLIPALRRDALANKPFITEMLPGTHPLEELEAALLRVSVTPLPSLLFLLHVSPPVLL